MRLLRPFIVGMVLAMFGAVPITGAPASAAQDGGAPRQYRAVDLGTLGGYSGAAALNDCGQVVGSSGLPDGGIHPFLWQGGVMTDLGLPPGMRYAYASDINGRGTVVGLGVIPSPPRWQGRAFLWRNGTMTDLGTLGGWSSSATAVNDRDQAIGWSDIADGSVHAVLWDNGGMTDLGPGSVSDINNRGEIVGSRAIAGGQRHGVLWQRGTMTDLGTLGGPSSAATAVNDSGQVIGWSDTADGQHHGFLWQQGLMTDLGTLGGSDSNAGKISDRGDILGTATTAGNELRPVLWRRGVITDLTTGGVPAKAFVNAINNRGQLAGTDPSNDHAVLFT